MHRAPLFAAITLLLLGPATAVAIDPLKEAAYSNFSTAPAFIAVQLEDPQSGETTAMALVNAKFAAFMATLWGVKQAEVDTVAFQDRYLAFMIEHDGTPIRVDFATARRFFNWDATNPTSGMTPRFDRPYSLAELGFAKTEDLLDAYFDFDPTTGAGVLRRTDSWKAQISPWEPRFIALLIELGYYVDGGPGLSRLRIQRP